MEEREGWCDKNCLQLSPHHRKIHLSPQGALQTPLAPTCEAGDQEDLQTSPPDPTGGRSTMQPGLYDSKKAGALSSVSPHSTGLATVLPRSVLLLLCSPRLSLSPLAHFQAHLPHSIFSIEAASVPYCCQCASHARSKMCGFNCLAAIQGLRAGTVPGHSGPALVRLSGTDTR